MDIEEERVGWLNAIETSVLVYVAVDTLHQDRRYLQACIAI